MSLVGDPFRDQRKDAYFTATRLLLEEAEIYKDWGEDQVKEASSRIASLGQVLAESDPDGRYCYPEEIRTMIAKLESISRKIPAWLFTRAISPAIEKLKRMIPS